MLFIMFSHSCVNTSILHHWAIISSLPAAFLTIDKNIDVFMLLNDGIE